MADAHYRTALVTGASSGIGAATARALRSHGLEVIACARREDRLKALADEIGARYIVCDLRDQQAVYEALGGLEVDVLVNNAGIGRGFTSITKASPEDIEATVGLNVMGLLHAVRALVPGMIDRARGHIVNIGSVAGLHGCAPVVYGASKGAVHLLSQDLRMDLSGSGVRVTEICPGRVMTEFFDIAFDDEEAKRKFTSGFTLLEAGDVAECVVHAINAPWRVNIATIEVIPTEQAIGGVQIQAARTETRP